MDERNIGWEVANRLVDVHGFEPAPEHPGRFRRIVDSQHAVLVTFSRWDEPNGGALRASFYFGIARRDINELWRDLLDPRVLTWRPTLQERPTFFDDGRPLAGFSDRDYTAEEMADWLDLWVPRLVSEAPCLPFLRAKLADEAFQNRSPDATQVPRMINKLLDGEWTEEEDEEWFGRWRQTMKNRPSEHVGHQAAVRKTAAVRAWLEAHPDGVERELVD